MTKKEIKKCGLNRDIIDKFYTKKHIALKCIEKIFSYLNLNDSIVIEPSAGDGAFSDILITKQKDFYFSLKSYDIKPGNDNIIEKDFLSKEMENILKNIKKDIHFIGNPPFGRQSSLAKKFIKICCKYGKSISFILPKSFKKPSMYNSFNNYFHKIYEIELEPNSFLLDNKNKDVPCIFQIWIKKNVKREIIKKINPEGFEYIKDKNSANIALRRVGVYAGNLIINDFDNLSEQSHHFIKFDTNINIDDFKDEYLKHNFTGKDDTVGPKSINKTEFNKVINSIIKKLNEK